MADKIKRDEEAVHAVEVATAELKIADTDPDEAIVDNFRKQLARDKYFDREKLTSFPLPTDEPAPRSAHPLI
jgi:hypothetical protein